MVTSTPSCYVLHSFLHRSTDHPYTGPRTDLLVKTSASSCHGNCLAIARGPILLYTVLLILRFICTRFWPAFISARSPLHACHMGSTVSCEMGRTWDTMDNVLLDLPRWYMLANLRLRLTPKYEHPDSATQRSRQEHKTQNAHSLSTVQLDACVELDGVYRTTFPHRKYHSLRSMCRHDRRSPRRAFTLCQTPHDPNSGR